MDELLVRGANGLTYRYVRAEHRDPERASALVRAALAERGVATVAIPRHDGRAKLVLGDAIEVNSGQVVVEFRVLDDTRAVFDGCVENVRGVITSALAAVAERASCGERLAARDAAIVKELLDLRERFEALSHIPMDLEFRAQRCSELKEQIATISALGDRVEELFESLLASDARYSGCVDIADI